jgi:glutamate-ammonia-ligase adenylyltransferase
MYVVFVCYYVNEVADWERMALVCARLVVGDEVFGSRLLATITVAAYGHGPSDAGEIARIRGRMERELAGEKPGLYHPKIGHGALCDVELLAQAMQMRHGDDARVRLPHTREALGALASHGYLAAAETETLLAAQAFLRHVEQALRLLDETREPLLRRGSIRARQVARLLGVRDRDGTSGEDALFADYIRHASEVRRLFSRHLAPVDVASPFPEAAT